MTKELPTVCELFALQARSTPDAIAVIGNDHSLTYRELDQQSTHIASKLMAMGSRPGSFIGICMERQAHLLSALLGILKTGAAYVPLDPSYPAERLSYILAETKPSVVIAAGDVSHLLPKTTEICLLSTLLEADNESLYLPSGDLSKDSVSYVIFTSGSTGKPKGTLTPHSAFSYLITQAQELLHIGPGDRWLAMTPTSFDASVLELFIPICFGATVVLATREQVLDVSALTKLIRELHVTIVAATPAMWRMLQTAGDLPSSIKPFRHVISGGEALGRELANYLLSISQNVWNLYGPTEATVFITSAAVSAEGDVHLGFPLKGTSLYVLNNELEPMPVGVAGELYIGGPALALGYLNQPQLTAEKFIPNPFGQGRLYRTGDLVRRREDGALDFLGRVDLQVKLRGYRIELGEIEEALASHPAVHHAVVTSYTDEAGNTRLAGYYQPKASITASELARHVGTLLPNYMVPTAFESIEHFPMTPTGKVDRKALPPPTQLFKCSDNYVAPRVNNEIILAQMWTVLFGIERIGINDNFFELGGDSLNAAELLALIRKRFNQELSLSILLSYPTIAEMATLLGKPLYEMAPQPSVQLNQTSEESPSLFCVPPIGGVATVYAPLARALSGQVALYGLQVAGVHYTPERGEAMVQLVTSYADEIQKRKPTGAINLICYSAGGAVAHALMNELIGRGRQLGIVILISPGGRPPRDYDGFDYSNFFWRIWGGVLDDIFDLREEYAFPLVELTQAMMKDPKAEVDAYTTFVWPKDRPDAAAVLPGKITPEVYTLLVRGGHINWLAFREYYLEPLALPPTFDEIWLVQAADDDESRRRQGFEEWSAYMRTELRCHIIPGSHGKLLSYPKSVAALALLIRQAVNRQEEKKTSVKSVIG